MLEAKVITQSPADFLVLTQAELDQMHNETQELLKQSVVGTRWTVNDCIERLRGYRREAFVNNVLKPKRQELESIGAVLHWSSGGRGSGKYLFRATVMSQWLEDNLQQITDGGW